MPDDAIERARLFLANYTIGFPLCESERQAIAHIMLAFASQQAPGMVLAPADATDQMIIAGMAEAEKHEDMLGDAMVAIYAAMRRAAMLDAAPSVTLGEVG